MDADKIEKLISDIFYQKIPIRSSSDIDQKCKGKVVSRLFPIDNTIITGLPKLFVLQRYLKDHFGLSEKEFRDPYFDVGKKPLQIGKFYIKYGLSGLSAKESNYFIHIAEKETFDKYQRESLREIIANNENRANKWKQSLSIWGENSSYSIGPENRGDLLEI